MLASDAETQRSAPRDWQQVLAEAWSDPVALLARLGLQPDDLAVPLAANSPFALRVPEPFVGLMRYGDPSDPLLLQVLPLQAEQMDVAGYQTDPLQELDSAPVPGVVHKYQNRVLLVSTGACAVNCRYCFRRHFPYSEQTPTGSDWAAAVAYIRDHPELNEVILSGGDPLALSDRRLDEMIAALEAVPHIKRLRLHTRLPVVLPQRVTAELLALLEASRLQVSVMLHINHAQEMGPDLRRVAQLLRESVRGLYNQSVLLAGINDSVEALTTLSEDLFDAGIQPYYLNLLDPVQGAAHFDVDADRARALYAGLLARVSGYLAPRLVREQPGAANKLPIAP